MGLNDANGGNRRTGLVRNRQWWVWLLPGLLAVAVAAIVFLVATSHPKRS
jgi:hypothetical protein